MAAKSNLTNMALVLSATCLICAAILGCVYAVTAAPIAETNANIQKGGRQHVSADPGEPGSGDAGGRGAG